MNTIDLPHEIVAGILAFELHTHGFRPEYKAHTKGTDALPLLLNVAQGYDQDRWFSRATHFMLPVEDRPENRDELIPMLSFVVSEGNDPTKLIHELAGLKFSRIDVHGHSWIVSSTGHAGLCFGANDAIHITPDPKDGTWEWKREMDSYREFAQAMDCGTGELRGRCASRELAMAEALGAKETLRGEVASLAKALGIVIA